MNVWDLIKQRVEEGWEFQVGKHEVSLRGYWAGFLRDIERCPECEEMVFDWDACGHALTIQDAISMADRIAQGEFGTPDVDEFE